MSTQFEVRKGEHNSTKIPNTTMEAHMPLSLTETHLPFLIISLPSNGPKTGSTDSSRFSIKTCSPAARARSIVSRYLWETVLASIMVRLDAMLRNKEAVKGTEGGSALQKQLCAHARTC